MATGHRYRHRHRSHVRRQLRDRGRLKQYVRRRGTRPDLFTPSLSPSGPGHARRRDRL
ncbi:hypothetical protein E4U52_008391 [Claviceps spartinae]|nr:hypothetical protein E4U52_008391 [Claviceps spartinae]